MHVSTECPGECDLPGRGNHRLDGDRIEDCTTPPKVCTKCDREYPATPEYFRADERYAGGLESWCKECKREYTHTHYIAHRDEVLTRSAAYKAAHSDERDAWYATYRVTHRADLLASKAAYNATHRDERAAYYAAHRDEINERARAYRAANREEMSARERKRRYGLLPGEWDAMFAEQGDSCAICGADNPGSKQGWHTDHNHETGQVRGVLCHHCNAGLGFFRDDPERLIAASEYLATR